MTNADDPRWEARVQAVWATAGESSDDEVVAAIDALATERPVGDPAVLYEQASAYDYAGQESTAEPLYREALNAGLTGERGSDIAARPPILLAPARPASTHPRSGTAAAPATAPVLQPRPRICPYPRQACTVRRSRCGTGEPVACANSSQSLVRVQ